MTPIEQIKNNVTGININSLKRVLLILFLFHSTFFLIAQNKGIKIDTALTSFYTGIKIHPFLVNNSDLNILGEILIPDHVTFIDISEAIPTYTPNVITLDINPIQGRLIMIEYGSNNNSIKLKHIISSTLYQQTYGAEYLPNLFIGDGNYFHPMFSPPPPSWSLGGNLAISNSNFLGSINNAPLRIKVNNQNAGFIDSTKSNTSFGYEAGIQNSNLLLSNSQNVALGYKAMKSNNTGSENIAIGDSALIGNVSGTKNVAIGSNALVNSMGSNNIAIGSLAGSTSTFSGSNNIFIGDSTRSLGTANSNIVAIGHDIIANCSDCVLLGSKPTSKVGIGTVSPLSKLDILGGNNWDLVNTNGDLSIGNTSYRMKFGVALDGGGAGEGNIRATGGIRQLRLAAGNAPNGLVIRGDSVGIGLSSPQSRLEIRDGGLGISTSTKRYELNYDNSGYFYMDEFGTGRHFAIKNGGNIGIGTTSPSAPLHVYKNLSNQLISVFENNGGWGEIQVKNTGNTAHLGVSQSGLGYGYVGSSTYHDFVLRSNNESRLTISKDGNIGIGTTTPTIAKLQINGFLANTLNPNSGGYSYLKFISPITGNGSGESNYSIHASDRIAASEFNAFSDSRIKKNKATSSYKNDMSILSKINVTNYQLIDSISKGNAQVKGFIAQQIEEVYPQAVSKIKDFVPDVYCLSTKVYKDKESNEFTVEVNKSTSIKSGDKVKLIIEDKEIQVDILTASEKSFSFKSDEKIGDKVFVYGKEVEDFRSIDYNQIFALGISGIQQLMKENESMHYKMNTIQNNFDELSAQVAELKNMLERKVSIGMK